MRSGSHTHDRGSAMANTRHSITRRRTSLRSGSVAGVALGALAAATMIVLASGRSIADEPPSADEVVEQEVQGLLEAGLAEDDPKVQALRADLERSAPADATEPEGLIEADRELLAEQPDYDRGRVRCDVVPPDLLTIDEIEGATCVVAPQPDGTARYVAIAPDGVARVVLFGDDGPQRLEDQRVEALGDASIDVSDAGEIVVERPDGDRALIELE